MDSYSDHIDIMTSGTGRWRAPVVECRECQVICELVVAPWRCLKTRQECIYAFTDGDSTYFGCLHKVFAPELDLNVFEAMGVAGERRGDPYGAVRVTGAPRAECPVSVERAYIVGAGCSPCVNPTFVREAFKVTAAKGRKTWGGGLLRDDTADR